MRVAIFAGYYLPHIGGYCRNIHELAKRLVPEHDVTVITCNTENSPSTEMIDGVRVVRMPLFLHPGKQLPIPSMFAVCGLLLRRSDFDLVVTQSRIFPLSLIGALYAVLHRVPLVHVERGSCHTVLPSRMLSYLVRVYDHVFGRAIVVSSWRSVGISQKACEFVSHLSAKAAPQLIHNGIDIPTGVVRRAGTPVRIVFVGRVIFAKGVQDLVAAFARVVISRQTTDNLELIVVGDGPYLQTLQKIVSAITERNVQERIKFVGGVKPEEVNAILSTCDIFVNPSYSEGLPTTVMEAASVGLPIIATDVGGTDEVIIDGVSGLLVRPHDVSGIERSLGRMLDHLDKAAGMGYRAKEIVSSFSWSQVVDNWKEILAAAQEENHRRK